MNIRIIFYFLCLCQLNADSVGEKLSQAAMELTKNEETYDGSYYCIDYPNGDVPKNIGVCSDVVIRSYRALGTNLQQAVHEDIKENFHLYPHQNWGAKKPDTNIDHRRVPNLQVFFTRYGKKLPVSKNSADYVVGDIVTWNLASKGNIPHIGIISGERSPSGTPLIIHSIGRGTELSDILFEYKITGHYQYEPQN